MISMTCTSGVKFQVLQAPGNRLRRHGCRCANRVGPCLERMTDDQAGHRLQAQLLFLVFKLLGPGNKKIYDIRFLYVSYGHTQMSG
jgi:hypothetical protein